MSNKTGVKVLLGILAVPATIAVIVWISSLQDDQKRREAEAAKDSALFTAGLDERVQASKLRLVELEQGELASSTLKSCYYAGYPTDRIPGSAYNVPGSTLSRRRVAECDRIIKNLKAQEAADDREEKRKDAEYDRRHAGGNK